MSKTYPIKRSKDIDEFLYYIRNKNGKSTRERNYIMVITGLYTGLRISDILALKVKDVRGKDVLNIVEEKTGKKYTRVINEKLKKEFEKYCRDKEDNEYLIKSQQGYNEPLGRKEAWKIIKRASRAVRIQGNVSTHSLRKTFAWRIYIKSGKDLEEVRRALNHSDIYVTKEYLGIDEESTDNYIRDLDF